MTLTRSSQFYIILCTMTHKSALFYLLFFILASQSWAAGETLKVMEQDLWMTVDQNGNASITLTLGNSSNSPVPLTLSVSDFKHAERGGKDYLLGATPIVAGAAEADRSKLTKQQLGPGETVAVKITVVGLWEAGESTAQLSNAGQSLATLRALRRPAAYNVQIESQGLGVFEGAAAIIAIGFGADTLKNLITQKPPESK
jgi:hypothetical protein